jgi:hypothetical protein
MEAGQGPNVGCSAKEKKISGTFFCIQDCPTEMVTSKMHNFRNWQGVVKSFPGSVSAHYVPQHVCKRCVPKHDRHIIGMTHTKDTHALNRGDSAGKVHLP